MVNRPAPHARPTACRLAITPKKQDSGFALELRLGGGWFKHMRVSVLTIDTNPARAFTGSSRKAARSQVLLPGRKGVRPKLG